MIKKIGSNKYGVVEYAISSVEDIADLPLGVAIGSTAVLINKDGIRTFALGEGEWVEYIDAERYDKNKLAQDLLFCGFGNDGEKHDDLDDRLMVEFDEINERVNVGNYLEYNGCHVKADYSLEGLQRGVMLEGRTLQNLIPTKWIVNGNVGGHATYNVDTKVISAICDGSYSHARFGGKDFLGLIKADTIYTICFKTRREGSSVERHIALGDYYSEDSTLYMATIPFTANAGVTQHMYSFRVYSSYKTSEITDATQLRFTVNSIPDGSLDIYDIVLLEGDHTNTPIEELPFIEGIESVGESELTDDSYKISGKSCGRNLIDARSGYTAMPNYLNAVIKNDVLTLDINPQPNTTRSVTYQFELKDIILNVGDIYAISGKVEFENVANIRILMVSPNTTSNTASHYIFGEGEFKGNLVVKEALTHKESLKYQYPLSIEVNVTPKDYTQPQKVVLSNFQLEKNDHVTPYEPYKESTYSIDLPLRSLPDGTCDTYDFESGILTQRVEKVVLDGSYTYYVTATETNTIKIQTASKHKEDFKCRPSSRVFCDTFPFMFGSDDIEHFRPDGGTPFANFTLWINKTRLSSPDIDGFKEWIQANPITVYYKLNDPIIHQLDRNRIYSFKDTTHVTSDNLIAPRITTNILTNSNALISHLKGENLALANEVSTLSLRNRETQETNETQDRIIDASLCAVDELYMMYETTQEVEAMSADEEGSRMVDMYVAMVQRGLKTIDQVPVRYRERVREILAQLED